jgi:hypothetical protein
MPEWGVSMIRNGGSVSSGICTLRALGCTDPAALLQQGLQQRPG